MTEAWANGRPVIELELRRPARGAWSAELELVGEPIAGRVSLEIGEVRLEGTAVRSGVVDDRARVSVVGGAGRLLEVLSPKSYRRTPVRIVAEDIARGAGESWGSSSVVTEVDRWVRVRGTAAAGLDACARAAGAVWRVLEDGRVWFGVPDWPESLVEHVDVLEDLGDGRLVFASESVELEGGLRLDGRMVDSVIYRMTGSSLRGEAWYAR